MAFSDPLVFSGQSHYRLIDGLYRNSGTGPDTPNDFLIKNTLNPDGVSSFLTEYRVAKNSLDPGGKDDVARCLVQFKYPGRRFTTAEMEAIFQTHMAFYGLPGHFARLHLGER